MDSVYRGPPRSGSSDGIRAPEGDRLAALHPLRWKHATVGERSRGENGGRSRSPVFARRSQQLASRVYRVFLLATCGSIFALFASLIIAYYWRSRTPPFWDAVDLPPTLWLSTGLLAVSSVRHLKWPGACSGVASGAKLRI